MQFHICCTPTHEKMMRELLLPTVEGFDVLTHRFEQECQSGVYGSEGWERAILHKLEVLLDAAGGGAEPFVYSDCDVILDGFTPQDAASELGDHIIVGQDDLWSLCAGFMVMRPGQELRDMLLAAKALIEAGKHRFDQRAINEAIKTTGVKTKLMPRERYSCLGHLTNGAKWKGDFAVFDRLPPRVKMFHANFADLEQKPLALTLARLKCATVREAIGKPPPQPSPGVPGEGERAASAPAAAVPRERATLTPDRIVCLNLESRPDRWERFCASFAGAQAFAGCSVVRHRARLLQEIIVPDWWASTGHNPTYYATGLDHQAIISAAYLEGCQTLLVFEDDAVLAEGFDANYAAAMGDLPKNWMGLWLGGVDYSASIAVTPHLVRLRKRTQTHAYLLSRRGMHRLYSHVTHERKVVFDWAAASLHGLEPHFYAPPIPIVSQTCPDRGKEKRG